MSPTPLITVGKMVSVVSVVESSPFEGESVVMPISDPPVPQVLVASALSKIFAIFEEVKVTCESQRVQASISTGSITFSDADGVPEVLCEEDELAEGD